MKIQSVKLNNFKKFGKSPEFSFTNSETGLAQDIIILIGMNGSGKTSLLQAIAATIGVATNRLHNLYDLEWPGFNYELIGDSWKHEPEVSIKVQFSKSELETIQDLHKKLQELGRNYPITPAEEYTVNLQWRNERVQADKDAKFFQFKGRDYAKQLIRSEGFEIFKKVGTILWYNEQRTSTSLTPEDKDSQLEITEDSLRDRFSKWRQFHLDVEAGKIELRRGQKDLYAEIEEAYKRVFPCHEFSGPVPRNNVDDILKEPWFYLYDDKNQYEISEMSGGERAIFPMLIDFANWNIHNSIILIDEIELHLHPPMQQALLRALPKLGNNNQFIITTHSDYIEQLVPDGHIIRLEG
jgi:AAA15 family ATPase/GTPase